MSGWRGLLWNAGVPSARELLRYVVEGIFCLFLVVVLRELADAFLVWWRRRRGPR